MEDKSGVDWSSEWEVGAVFLLNLGWVGSLSAHLQTEHGVKTVSGAGFLLYTWSSRHFLFTFFLAVQNKEFSPETK